MAQSLSECLRGESLMLESNVNVIDLQCIEGSELSQAWKVSRRERMKIIEAKIWDDFINEKDIVSCASNDDPYQFLDQLPDNYLREIMDAELELMKKQTTGVTVEQHNQPEPKEVVQEPRDTMVTFAEDQDDTECEMITILDDDDEASEERGEAEEDTESPCTVREKPDTTPEPAVEPEAERVLESLPRAKSPEHVTSMIETSIYTAKVKELQSKVNLELLSVITTLEVQNLSRIEPHSIPKLQKQCSEFCARYCRIYLYPMTRQIHDITRHNHAALPFARHTHIRSQVLRAVSLQQNMLQSLQVIHKWFAQKTPLRECVYSLKNLIQLVRDGDSVCPIEIKNEELLQTCQNLSEVLESFLGKINNFLQSYNVNVVTNHSRQKKLKHPLKKKSAAPSLKQGPESKQQTDSKLSMYSPDGFRFAAKFSTSALSRSSAGTSKARLSDTLATTKNAVLSPKKTHRSRRPLMRAPLGVHRRSNVKESEPDNISTLVEGVDMATISTQGSPTYSAGSVAQSPQARRASRGIRKVKDVSPARQSPKRRGLNKNMPIDVTLKGMAVSDESLPEVIKVQCAKRDLPVKIDEVISVADPKQDKGDQNKRGEINERDSGSDVSSIIRRLCAGQMPNKLRLKERTYWSKNAQLLCVNNSSPRQPSHGTTHLLRILEETIQKQAPKPQFYAKPPVKDVDRYRMSFNTSSRASDALFQYRTKFVQHMLSSPMYANSAVGKPWEMISSVSEKIIDDILLSCAKEMEIEKIAEALIDSETK